jgi:hypothetical protein
VVEGKPVLLLNANTVLRARTRSPVQKKINHAGCTTPEKGSIGTLVMTSLDNRWPGGPSDTTVASSVGVLATSLENAPKPDSKIRAKVLVKPIRTSTKGRGTSAKDRMNRSSKGRTFPPLWQNFLVEH